MPAVAKRKITTTDTMKLKEPSGTIANQSYLGFKMSQKNHRMNVIRCPGFCGVQVSVVTTQLDLQWGIAMAMALKILGTAGRCP